MLIGKHNVMINHEKHDGYYFTEMCSGSEAGSYLRLKDLCITQL